MKRSLWASIPFLILTLTGAGCSGFSQQWQDATRQNTNAWEGIEGPWVGRWIGDGSGHIGGLRCIVRRSSAAEMKPGGAHDFYYHATWGGLFSGSFKTSQPVREAAPGRYVSEGDWTLPKWAGGTYHYHIEATPTDWRGTYRSVGENGRMEMRRPPK
jgi:hypothetical protein